MVKTFNSSTPTFLDRNPQVVLVVALLKDLRQLHRAGADVPEKNAKGIHVDHAVVLASENLGRHVDGRADDAPWDHHLGLAETQVGDFGAVEAVEEDVLQLNVSVDEAVVVEEAEAMHHVQRDLQAEEPVKAGLEAGVQVARQPFHDQVHVAAAAVVVVLDDRAANLHDAVILRQRPGVVELHGEVIPVLVVADHDRLDGDARVVRPALLRAEDDAVLAPADLLAQLRHAVEDGVDEGGGLEGEPGKERSIVLAHLLPAVVGVLHLVVQDGFWVSATKTKC